MIKFTFDQFSKPSYSPRGNQFGLYLHKFINDVVYVDKYDYKGVMKLLVSDEEYEFLRKSVELNFNMPLDKYLDEIIDAIIKSNKFYKECIVKNEKEMLHFCD